MELSEAEGIIEIDRLLFGGLQTLYLIDFGV